jgi:hypothetical protein
VLNTAHPKPSRAAQAKVPGAKRVPFTSDIYVRSENRPLALAPRSIDKETLSAKLKVIFAERYLGFILLHAYFLVSKSTWGCSLHALTRQLQLLTLTGMGQLLASSARAANTRPGLLLTPTQCACAASTHTTAGLPSTCLFPVCLSVCPHTQFVCPLYFSWRNLGLGMLVWTINIIGINFSFHRQLTHKSFKSSKVLEYFAAWCGTLGVQGGPIEW